MYKINCKLVNIHLIYFIKILNLIVSKKLNKCVYIFYLFLLYYYIHAYLSIYFLHNMFVKNYYYKFFLLRNIAYYAKRWLSQDAIKYLTHFWQNNLLKYYGRENERVREWERKEKEREKEKVNVKTDKCGIFSKNLLWYENIHVTYLNCHAVALKKIYLFHFIDGDFTNRIRFRQWTTVIFAIIFYSLSH